MVQVALGILPPWLLLASLLGVINAAAGFMLVGRHLSHITWYVLLGLFAASLGQVVATALALPNPLPIGDLNVMVASVGAWLIVLLARLRGL